MTGRKYLLWAGANLKGNPQIAAQIAMKQYYEVREAQIQSKGSRQKEELSIELEEEDEKEVETEEVKGETSAGKEKE